MNSTRQGASELSTAPNDTQRRIELFVRRRFDSAMHLIAKERKAARIALMDDRIARGHGLILDPLSPLFDQIEVFYCEALLRAKADALFEAYEVYDVAPDDAIWKELNKHKQSLVASRKGSLKQEATGRAVRMGLNTAHGIARAQALGQEIERSTHAVLKALACEIEKRMMARKREDPPFTGSAKSINVHPKVASNSTSPIRRARRPSTVHSPVAVRQIEEFMTRKVLSEAEFAELAKTTYKTIHKVLVTARFKRSMLDDIAKVLRITREELIQDS